MLLDIVGCSWTLLDIVGQLLEVVGGGLFNSFCRILTIVGFTLSLQRKNLRLEELLSRLTFGETWDKRNFPQ